MLDVRLVVVFVTVVAVVLVVVVSLDVVRVRVAVVVEVFDGGTTVVCPTVTDFVEVLALFFEFPPATRAITTARTATAAMIPATMIQPLVRLAGGCSPAGG